MIAKPNVMLQGGHVQHMKRETRCVVYCFVTGEVRVWLWKAVRWTETKCESRITTHVTEEE